MAKEDKLVYQIKVVLRGITPPIWRRIIVNDDITLHRLHSIIQDVMGWYNCHLHQFIIGEEYFSEPSPENEQEIKNSKKTKLKDVIKSGKTKFIYEYDFGDCWDHEIIIEKMFTPEHNTNCPVCIDGKRACPPEDCGGAPGYQDLLKILKNQKHKEYKNMIEWLGGTFDSEEFNITDINKRLKP